MSAPPIRIGRRAAAGLLAVAVVLPATACRSLAEDSEHGYEPATFGKADADGVKSVTFTEDAARRVSLQTATVTARGKRLLVPYAALIYDKKGASWVYAVPQPLTYQRVKVVVAKVSADEVALSVGPRPGTQVVTMGATEVYGAELGIASKH